jgi:hypothetical protein
VIHVLHSCSQAVILFSSFSLFIIEIQNMLHPPTPFLVMMGVLWLY